jgi:predicted lipoprotein with Yx(FWY)xxD motif
MKRILTIAAVAVALVVTLAACGSKVYGGQPSSSASAGNGAVSTQQINGFGTVLTDASGHPLYVNDQETKGGMILCNGSCLTIWPALTDSNGTPTGTIAAGTLGVVTRSDGTKQVTLNGQPLYTFYADQAGKVTGDNFHDSFNGTNFSWHVVRVGATSGSSGGSSGSGTGSSSGGGTTGGGSTGGSTTSGGIHY